MMTDRGEIVRYIAYSSLPVCHYATKHSATLFFN